MTFTLFEASLTPLTTLQAALVAIQNAICSRFQNRKAGAEK